MMYYVNHVTLKAYIFTPLNAYNLRINICSTHHQLLTPKIISIYLFYDQRFMTTVDKLSCTSWPQYDDHCTINWNEQKVNIKGWTRYLLTRMWSHFYLAVARVCTLGFILLADSSESLHTCVFGLKLVRSQLQGVSRPWQNTSWCGRWVLLPKQLSHCGPAHAPDPAVCFQHSFTSCLWALYLTILIVPAKILLWWWIQLLYRKIIIHQQKLI